MTAATRDYTAVKRALSGHGLAIDPGAKQCACAYFDRGSLTHYEFTLYPGGADLDWVVVERMQADERTRGIDLRNLLDCQFNGARAAAFAAGQAGRSMRVADFTPTQWKGSESKPIHHARAWDVLHADERRVLGGSRTYAVIDAAVEKGALSRWSRPGADYYPRGFELHNILDAVCLGLFHMGRLEKR